ncbi:hypothetical protein SLEP1_g3803 [Rubroshorea leprosula]|nr:hypothetical protein SLEP1_g3803 [Rubroshorea leprosula]
MSFFSKSVRFHVRRNRPLLAGKFWFLIVLSIQY